MSKVVDKRSRTAVNTTGMAKKTIVVLMIGLAFVPVRFAEAQQPYNKRVRADACNQTRLKRGMRRYGSPQR